MDQNKKQEYKSLCDELELIKLIIYDSKFIDINNPFYTQYISKLYDFEHMIHLVYFQSEDKSDHPTTYYEKTYCSSCKHDLIYHREDDHCSYSKNLKSCKCGLSYNDVLETYHDTVKIDEQGNEIEK